MRPVFIVFATASIVTASLASCGASNSLKTDSVEVNESSVPIETESPTPEVNIPMPNPSTGMYALASDSLDGGAANLSEYAGQVTLVVNVASRCGYTPQYKGLQELHTELAGQGFSVLGFPSNEFGAQEPGTASEIREFCSAEFGVSFPMFAKCEVKTGDGQSPVYEFLQEQTGEVPNWNFCKYLVGRDGQVIAFYKSAVAPDAAELREAIEKALG